MVDLLGGLWSLARGVVVLLVGVALMAGGWHLHQDAQQATETAIQTEGTVISSAVARDEVEDDDGPDVQYYPKIEYRYTFEGETYTSTSICPGTAEGCEASNYKDDRTRVEEFVSQYPEGETTTVYVLPDQPSRSFLVKTDSGSIAYFILMGIGALASLGGLLALGGGLKRFVAG